MSLSGLRKQFNKANQYLSETIGAAESTKLDDEYNEMERKTDVFYESISALIAGTNEYLQPNPATRAKMAAMGAMSKVRGTTKTSPYPQTEGLLSETMAKYGKSLGEDSDFGNALLDASEAYKQLADIKYQLEDNVKHNFLDPIAHLQINELKEVNHHRTKLKGRRLDYDCKKRKGNRDEELIMAEEKLEESKKLAEQAMFNVLSNDVEQISQLNAFIVAKIEYHRQSLDVLENLHTTLKSRIKEAASRPRSEHIPKPVLTDRTPSGRSPIGSLANSTANLNFNGQQQTCNQMNINPNYNTANGNTPRQPPPQYNATSGPSVSSAPPPIPQKPSCKALFDFEAQNEGELDFKEGSIITLISQIDENWFEGTFNGKTGYFPINYVQVIVPLPK
uniref:SH3 domain-containing GRB2-like protein n=1 Tax=Parastrongyloides trichosuri TaxID=131310 RepID=A0A0N4ZX01_PARTI